MIRIGFAVLLSLWATVASAQHVTASAHVSSARWSEFDGQDVGVGGRITFAPTAIIGLDADATWYPSKFPPDTVAAFSGSRVEGLFGVSAGPRIARVRPFARAAAGFLKIGATPKAFACIAIYPPPLNCTLAGGQTLPAYEIGGGVEVDATAKTFFRLDATSRFLKYPGPALTASRQVRNEDFVGGALRLTLGAGVRF